MGDAFTAVAILLLVGWCALGAPLLIVWLTLRIERLEGDLALVEARLDRLPRLLADEILAGASAAADAMWHDVKDELEDERDLLRVSRGLTGVGDA